MTIPDPLVYGSIPVLFGFVIWVGQRFVQETVSKFKKDGRSNAALDARSAPLSMNDFSAIGELLKKELNGRYMFAPEARERFAAIERKLDHLAAAVKMFVHANLDPNVEVSGDRAD